jgi:hypothetical protein
MKPIQTVPEPLQTQDAPVVIHMVYPEVVEDDTASRRPGLRPRSKVANADQDYVHSDKEQGQGMIRSNDDDPDYIDSDYNLSEDDDDLDVENPDEGEDKKYKKIRERIREKMEAKHEAKKKENIWDHIDDGNSEEHDLWAPDSDDEKGMIGSGHSKKKICIVLSSMLAKYLSQFIW